MQAGYMSIEAVKDLMAVKEGRIQYLEKLSALKDKQLKELTDRLNNSLK